MSLSKAEIAASLGSLGTYTPIYTQSNLTLNGNQIDNTILKIGNAVQVSGLVYVTIVPGQTGSVFLTIPTTVSNILDCSTQTNIPYTGIDYGVGFSINAGKLELDLTNDIAGPTGRITVNYSFTYLL